MRISLFTSLSLVALAVAAPQKRSLPTAAELDRFKLFAEWSASAGCMTEGQPAGTPVTCLANQCDTVASHNATVFSPSFTGTILDTRGYVAVDPVAKEIVLAFRGSVSTRNWVADFIFVQVPCDFTFGCLVHTGFLASWAEVKSRAMAAVIAARKANPTFKVSVTGYSLGAAVGTIAAAEIRRSLKIPVDLITFGSPRVGNNAFAKFVTAQAGAEYRLTHANDPITRLPPIIFNYRHTSPEYWFDEGADGIATLDEFTLCEGHANIKCNGGTGDFDMDKHGWYFQNFNGCSPPSTPFKTRNTEISDAEIAKIVNEWVKADKVLAKNLELGGEA
ncbi:Alpha/Beta hydrolase protein [Apiosordaria backusii]|uniref:Alpha/Beta hydrolase protein n=1 Tax=Apiosordaria backusii TaxID=314023 RepID=A0AA40BSJ2_9PEZI|nr:Alpha/Beta hydrolase protein [Apiosordaria backusii]